MAPSLSAMPHEVYLMCTKWLPDLKSLKNLRQTCKEANELIEAHEAEIRTIVVAREIGPELFPIAVASATAKHESSGLPGAIAAYKESPGDEEVIKKFGKCAAEFCSTRLAGKAMALTKDRMPELTLPMLHEMWDFHRTAAIYVDGFKERHNSKLPSPSCHPTSPAERLRLFKAFYILELARLVVPFEWRKRPGDPAFDAFWRAWAPWERNQVASVFHYLCSLIKPKAKETFNGKWTMTYEVPSPDRYVIHAGLRNVHTLLRNDHGEDVGKQFYDLQWYEQKGDLYRWRVFPKNFNSWQYPPDREIPATGASVNMPNIMEKYRDFGDNEPGPRDLWFFEWLGSHAMKEGGCWPGGRDRFDQWNKKLESLDLQHWGYTNFFSRDHLDALAEGQLLPSMEEMVEVTREWYLARGRGMGAGGLCKIAL